MRITIHRGADQIGGSVTEYEHDGWRLFVDFGDVLAGSPSPMALEIDGLTKGDLTKSALLITHYHADHIGSLGKIPEEVPVFMGKVGLEIQKITSGRLKGVNEKHALLFERLQKVHAFDAGKVFEFGPFKIMPIIMDHSAFDACAFRIEADDASVFHTGDFRTHGFRASKLPDVIANYIGKVDYVVCEGTNVSRPDATSLPEYELQKKFGEDFKKNKYNIVYLSSTNIDRLFALYHAALKAGLPFYVDAHQKRIMDAVTRIDHIWGKSKLYKYDEKYPPIELQYDNTGNCGFRLTDKFKEFLENRGYVLIARANPCFDSFIAIIPGEQKQRYLSMWKGFVSNPSSPAYNEALAKSIGNNYLYRHTSGHCDMKSLRDLITMLNPYAIIPIHTDNPEGFADLFCNECPVILMNDGNSFEFISSKYFDPCYGNVWAYKKPARITQGERWWEAEEHTPVICNRKKDALYVLKHLRFAPGRILWYEVENEEDLYPSTIDVYNSHFERINRFSWDGHEPGGEKYLTERIPAPGTKALAVISYPVKGFIPVEVIGPASEKLVRKSYESDKLREDICFDGPDTFEEYIESWNDWDWDSVAVRPLIKKFDEESEALSDIIFIPRIWLLPYKDLG